MEPVEEQPVKIALNADTIKELWSKTYNTEGKPDWSHILPFYDSENACSKSCMLGDITPAEDIRKSHY